jgi:hypothetical protein
VLDTLSEMINNIVSKNSLTLRQADTFYNNGKIIKALVYYYDGYVESSKLLPYIQTYKSVIIVPNNTVLETNYNLLFKEKIQNIVEHIQLEKISGSVKDENVLLNVKATYKGRGIDNFPVKFFSVYKHHVDRVICKSNGCQTKAPVKSILNKNNSIFIKAVPDFQTFEKYFTYNLTPKLFGSFDVLSVSFKDTLQNQEVIARNKNYKKLNQELDRKDIARNNSDRLSDRMRQELNGIRGVGRPPQIGNRRNRGSINFNIGFGKGRNRGNINIGRGW